MLANMLISKLSPGWAISTGASRPEISSISSLRGSKIGVSRIGSGSYVMGYVLADQQSWLSSTSSTEGGPFSEAVVLNDFATLRAGVNSGRADFFMWETFTSKKYHDSGEIRRVGEIYTPWSSWKIVASTKLAKDGALDPRIEDLFAKLDKGVQRFEEDPEGAVKWIASNLDYSEADARAWLDTVKFTKGVEGVKPEVVQSCVDILRKAGVLVEGKGMQPSEMVAKR